MSKQVINGNSFEYALILELSKSPLCEEMDIQDSLKKNFEELGNNSKNEFLKAAEVSINYLKEVNKTFFNTSYRITRQNDSVGAIGDVRDIVLVNSRNEELGISAKNNNESTKHSRLSVQSNFGLNWIGFSNSNTYFEEIKPIFNFLDVKTKLKENWSSISNKADIVYLPLLNAFNRELKRLSDNHNDSASNFISFLIGNKDFYKIIKTKKNVKIQCFNMYNRLPYDKNETTTQLVLPNKIDNIGLKEGSKNTSIVKFNNGWTVSMRIHNASSRVERSLKFDVKIIEKPKLLEVVLDI